MTDVKRYFLLLLTAGVVVAAVGCGSGSGKGDAGSDGISAAGGSSGRVTLRLGYFPNFTHAQPIVGLARGTFKDALGSDVTMDAKTFNAGPDEITALFAGAIDIGYIGPSPAVNGYIKSKGNDVRIIA